MLLSVDPGRFCGWARFDGPRLHDCGLAESKNKDYGARIVEIADQIPTEDCTEVACETMQAYRGSPGRAQSLLKVNLIAGYIAGRVSGHVTLYLPREWKGQLSKEDCAGQSFAVLEDDEAKVVRATLAKINKQKQDNVLDAVALGLVHTGRLSLIG